MPNTTWAAGGVVYWGDAPTVYGEVDDARSEAALRMADEMVAASSIRRPPMAPATPS